MKSKTSFLFLASGFVGATILLAGISCHAIDLNKLKESYNIPTDLDMAYWNESYQERIKNWKSAPLENPCIKKGTSIVVHTYSHRLYLCENGQMATHFHVAIGRKGIEKKAEGDLRTPVGTYNLSSPRSSDDFGMFIPVAYPTLSQRNRGYSGGAIGIHGPYFKFFQMWSFINVLLDWTQGCIAVGSNSEIEAISSWVSRQPKVAVHIFDERYQK